MKPLKEVAQRMAARKEFREIIARLNAETPTHFKRIIRVGLVLGSVGTVIIALPATLATAGVVITLPVIVNQVAGYMIAAGLVAGAVAKTAVENKEDLPKE